MNVLWIGRCSSSDKPIARGVAYNRLRLRQFHPAQLSRLAAAELGRDSDICAVFGRVSYAQRPTNVQLSPEKPASVQIRPESAASVRMSPGGAGGA